MSQICHPFTEEPNMLLKQPIIYTEHNLFLVHFPFLKTKESWFMEWRYSTT